MRVKAVVSNSIMVHLYDVVPNDILFVSGDERDPIIERIDRDGDQIKLVYRDRPDCMVKESNWMDPALQNSGHIFIHDLKMERLAFYGD